jgi:hypothetical protein
MYRMMNATGIGAARGTLLPAGRWLARECCRGSEMVRGSGWMPKRIPAQIRPIFPVHKYHFA